jgi:hypothetical protein
MKQENWEEFSFLVDSNLQSQHTANSTNTSESLNTTWHKIQTSIIQAALKKIPNKKVTARSFSHTFSPKATSLHFDLKKLGSIICKVKHTSLIQTLLTSNINQQIQYINIQHNFNIPLLNNHTNLPLWISQAKLHWKTLFNARNIENSQHLRQHINSAINNQCEQLITHSTKMINSILNRHIDPVNFINIKTTNSLITEPSQIKQHIQQHFCNWTSHRPYDEHLFNNTWQEEYQPKNNTNTEWYNIVLQNISTDEVIHTIQNFSNNKATGPSDISYEMLKHLSPNTLNTITTLFN